MLGKWWWRWLFERRKLWHKVLLELYGHERAHCLGSLHKINSTSPVLRGIASVSQEPYLEPLVNQKNFKWELKDGNVILFWEDWWSDKGILKDIFKRLYVLSKFKWVSVKVFSEMWSSNSGDSSFFWRCPLFQWELDQLAELKDILVRIQFSPERDIIRWISNGGRYSTSECCNKLLDTHSREVNHNIGQ